MRELHGWHADHGRHARDAHAPADNPVTRTRDSPKHAAQDALKLRMLLDPEARKAARLAYRQKVEAAEAGYAARHARPRPGDQARPPGELKPGEPEPEHASAGARDRPASEIAARRKPLDWQREERRRPERPRLPANETTQMAAGIGVTLSSVADALNVLPGRWDAVAASFPGAAVAGVAWGNKRWKDRHGHRPED
jgi:hypothetical protein